jgi:4-methyl-5(b-hydroxyethyl)-thiazole monophosphate biosynthesis
MRALVPLVDRFEEIEAVTVIDLLRRAGVDVTTAAAAGRRVTGSHAITIEADATLADVLAMPFDVIALPGGPGTAALNSVPGLHERLRKQHASGHLLAAICAAPTVLAAAGVLRGATATCYPGCEAPLVEAGANLSDEAVVTYQPPATAGPTAPGAIITSRGAGTAVPFALAIIAQLHGQKSALDQARRIAYPAATLGQTLA